MMRLPVTLLCAAALTACGEGSMFGFGGDNAICKLFQVDELSRYVGSSLAAGKNADAGLGCQWITKDKNGDVMIAIVPASLHEVPLQIDGYAALPDVGTQAFTAPYLDGWSAAAVVGQESIRVSVAGEVASAESAEALLRETIKRRGIVVPK